MPYLNSAHSPNGIALSPYTPDHTNAPPAPFNNKPSHAPNGLPTPTSDSHPNRGSGDYDDSRRSSVTNSIHTGMNNLGLGPASPYTSNNQSQSSCVWLAEGTGYPNKWIFQRSLLHHERWVNILVWVQPRRRRSGWLCSRPCRSSDLGESQAGGLQRRRAHAWSSLCLPRSRRPTTIWTTAVQFFEEEQFCRILHQQRVDRRVIQAPPGPTR